MLIRLDDVARQIGGRTLFGGAAMVLRAGDRVGLVGPNGAGKTTMLKLIAGYEPPDHGSVVIARGARIGMLRQEIDPNQPHSIREEAAKALAHLDALEIEMRELEAEMTATGERGEEIPSPLAERYDAATTRF